jgi:GNAT superfamily N-acetyltransferase
VRDGDRAAESFRVEIHARASLPSGRYAEIVALCSRAFEEPFAPYLAPFGKGTHVLGLLGAKLVSHALWVPRTLTCDGLVLASAYVEAVATEPRHQGRGCATHVMRALAGSSPAA